MPANKIQHFVPRCYLKPFCADEHGAAINLFNISRETPIANAPVRGQCARPYFYGDDGELERALQGPEGVYARCVKKAAADPLALDANDLRALRALLLLQVFRSAAWVDREKALFEAHRDLLEAEATPEFLAEFEYNRGQSIQLAFEMYESVLPHISDLETCVLVNETDREFITSDDPAVHTNRYHVQKRLIGGHGFRNSGAMLFLPMTPELLLVAFDSNVYKLAGRRAHLASVSNVHDVEDLNQLQVVHAASNLYFRSWSERTAVAAGHRRGKGGRREHWFELETLQETAPDTGDFAPVFPPFEHYPDRREVIHTQQVLPRPDRWCRVLPYTLRPKVIDTGTAAGLVRPTPLAFARETVRGRASVSDRR